MGKKTKAAVAANAAATSSAEACCTQGEEHLDAGDFQAALACFEQAISVQPTLQSAWYLRGVAAAELWESAGEARQTLQTAVESFDRVLALDTSTRSENRYLASLARAKLLTKAAAALFDQDEESGHSSSASEVDQAVVEAQRSFEEAVRLHIQWGHPVLDSEALGAWGEVLSQQMRSAVARLDLGACPHGSLPVLDLARTAQIVSACAAASEKFSEAVRGAPDPEDLSGGEDARWFTLHVEHLLAFVDFARELLTLSSACTAQVPPEMTLALQDLGSKAETAWREAAALAEANVQLSGGSDAQWDALALRGDVLAAAAGLLGGLRRPPEPSLPLPPAGPAAGDPLVHVGPDASGALTIGAVAVGALSASEDRRISEAEALALAEAAFVEAMARGGRDATATVGLSLGELLLGRARRLRRRSFAGGPSTQEEEQEALRCLQRAGEVFQGVAKLKGSSPGDTPDAQATAWYNLACVAGLLGRPDAAARALGLCVRGVKAGVRKRWLAEARADEDMQSVRDHPDVQVVLESK